MNLSTLLKFTSSSKATGAEINTGTNDEKYTTPKAITDSKVSLIDGTETLTNKTIDGDNNTISNLDLGNEVNWAAADNVTDRTAFASGDKLVIYEAGVGFRKIDYNDLPVATRDSLGLDTDDSPQFTGIELGNASDTTLTRSAAGKLAVEGNNVAMLDTDTVEITVANWNSGTTVDKTVSGITATNIVWVSPAPASYDKFVEFEIKATGQDTDEITFGASSTPDATINVNVVFEK